MGVLWQIGGALDIVVASPLSKCKKRPTSSCDASLFYFFTFKKVRSPCNSWSCWPSGLEPLDKPGQIGEFAAKIVQKHMSQSVLTLLWQEKPPSLSLFSSYSIKSGCVAWIATGSYPLICKLWLYNLSALAWQIRNSSLDFQKFFADFLEILRQDFFCQLSEFVFVVKRQPWGQITWAIAAVIPQYLSQHLWRWLPCYRSAKHFASLHWTLFEAIYAIWPRDRRLSTQVGEESGKFLGIGRKSP